MDDNKSFIRGMRTVKGRCGAIQGQSRVGVRLERKL